MRRVGDANGSGGGGRGCELKLQLSFDHPPEFSP